VLWRGKHDYAAGLAFGFCALIKLPLLLLGIYFVLRQRWAIVAGGATTIGVAGLSSLILFGIDGNIAWYQDWVVPYLNGYIPAFNVQSVDGFLVRLSKGEEFLIHWDPPLVPTLFHRIARFAIFAALFGGSFLLIWRGRQRAPMAGERGPSPRDLLEFSLMINLALITSPISWTHSARGSASSVTPRVRTSVLSTGGQRGGMSASPASSPIWSVLRWTLS